MFHDCRLIEIPAGSSPARERVFFYGAKFMTKLTPLTLLAAIVCSMLLTLPQRQSSVPAVLPENSNLISSTVATADSETDLPGFLRLDKGDPENRDTLDESPVAVAENPSEWPRLSSLYPELATIEQLANVPLAEAKTELEPLANHADPVIRLAAVEAISEMKTPEIPVSVTRALHDSNPLVRIAALDALAWRQDPEVVYLVEPLLFDVDREVRLTAIDTLAQLKGAQAVIALTGIMTDMDVGLRREVVNALGEIGGDAVVHLLRQARFDIDYRVRANALEILRELEDG